MNVKTILSSFGIHLPYKENKFTFAMHSHKISTPTGTPVPDEIPPLVDEDNSMVFTSHSVPFPATHDLRSLVAGNGAS